MPDSPAAAMHADELPVDTATLQRLLRHQFPEWADLPVTPLPIGGTDHALFRLGSDLVARLPRIDWAAEQAERDARWLPVLAPHLPLAVPAPVAVGRPGDRMPWPWTVVPWYVGGNPTPHDTDLDRAALDLAGFVGALHRVDTTGGEESCGSSRGAPLATRDDGTRDALAQLADRVDVPALTEVWDDALAAKPWTGPSVWIHGDLEAGNLIAHEGRLSAVIDYGALGVGDPAADLMPAWAIFEGRSRAAFREAVGYDEHTWRRSRGWALSTAVIALPYYWDTFPGIVTASLRKLTALLADRE